MNLNGTRSEPEIQITGGLTTDTTVLFLTLWLVKLFMTRRLDRHFSIAAALFVTSGVLSSYVSTTTWWLQLAHRIPAK